MLKDNSNLTTFPSASTQDCCIALRPATVRRALPLIVGTIDASRLAELAAHDPGLAFHLLRSANSAAIRAGGTPIYRLDEAIFFAESGTVRELLMTQAPFHLFGAIETLGAHSRLTALIARRMAELGSDCDPVRAYIAGLLHDLGKLPSITGAVSGSHSSVGRSLAINARLPLFIVDAISNHHRPEAAEIDPQLVRLISVADQLACGLAITNGVDRTSAVDTLRNGIALFRQSDPSVVFDLLSSPQWFPMTTSASPQFDGYTQ